MIVFQSVDELHELVHTRELKLRREKFGEAPHAARRCEDQAARRHGFDQGETSARLAGGVDHEVGRLGLGSVDVSDGLPLGAYRTDLGEGSPLAVGEDASAVM